MIVGIYSICDYYTAMCWLQVSRSRKRDRRGILPLRLDSSPSLSALETTGGGDKGLSLCIDYRSTFRFLLSILTSSFPSFCYYRLGASRYCRSSTRIASFLRTSRLALCFVIWRSRVHISVRRSPLLTRCSWFSSVTSR
jgi:hypothetical protein